MVRLPLLCTLLLLAVAAPAAAMVQLPENPAPVAGNPADRLLSLPIEDSAYDGARRCTPKASRPGMLALQRWLEANARGVFWGSYRCEKWGKAQASLSRSRVGTGATSAVRQKLQRRAGVLHHHVDQPGLERRLGDLA